MILPWYSSLLLTASASNDELIRSFLLTSLVTKCRFAPRRARSGTADGCLTFTTTVRVIVGVHDAASNVRTDTHVADTASFAVVDQVVVDVSDDADRSSAVQRNHSHFAGGKTQGCVLAFLSHQLSTCAGAADHLAALAGMELDVVYHSTYRDLCKREAVADSHFSLRSVHDLHAVHEALGRKDICLLAVLIADQSDIRCSVGIVLNSDDSCGNAVFASLEIDDPVFPSASAAVMSHGDLTLVVTACVLLQREYQREPVIFLREGVYAVYFLIPMISSPFHAYSF